MKGILWYVTRKLEGIFDGILMEFYIKSSFDGILMEFYIKSSEDKNQILKSMYIPRFLSSGLYGSFLTSIQEKETDNRQTTTW